MLWSPWIIWRVNLVIWYCCDLVLSLSFNYVLTESTSLIIWRDYLDNWCRVNLIVIRMFDNLFYELDIAMAKS